MPSIETAIVSRLTGYAGLSALVSTRVYEVPVPQEPTYPLVCFELVGGADDYSMSGPTGAREDQFVIGCYATTAPGARAVADQVELALGGQRGTWGSVVVMSSFLSDRSTAFEEVAPAQTAAKITTAFCVSMELRICYQK